MDIKIVLKSLALGGILALAAIMTEFLFLFNDDGMMEMHPGPVSLFVWHFVFFSGSVLLLLLQFRFASGNMQKKFNISIVLQTVLFIMYFLFLIIKPLWLSGLAAISAVFLIVVVVKGISQTNKQYLFQAGVYFFIACLCLLVTMTTYIVEE